MSDRLCKDWLATYLDYSSEQESPESLHLWSAFVCLSAAIRRKVFIEHEYQRKVYPNLYVIVVAESAKIRKSTAANMGMDILMNAFPDMKIMRDSMTSQGLIHQLNKKVQTTKDDKIVEELRSDVTIHADEVANLFGYDRVRASQMVIFLTRTYECPSVYDHTTVRDSLVRLHNLYPVLLGATDPRNLKVLPEDAVGGLTGRLIWVIEGQRRKNNTGWKRNAIRAAQLELIRERLIHDLQIIGRLHGEVTATQDAMGYYDAWYEELSRRDAKDPDTDAFYNRCHTTALRLAILLSVSEGDELVVTKKQMAAAIVLIEKQLPEVKRVTMWGGASEYAQHRARLIHFLQASGGVSTKRKALKHMGMPIEEFDLKLIATLVQDGTLVSPKAVGSEIVLALTKAGTQPPPPLAEAGS